MNPSQLISLAISVSIWLIVFGLGLKAHPQDIVWLFRRPGLLVRSILSVNVIMVIVAALAISVFTLDPAIEIAILALAMSPVPPVLPMQEHKTGGDGSYSIGLMVAASLLSIILVPAWTWLLARHFDFEANLHIRAIVNIIFITILSPLIVGVLVGRSLPRLAKRIVKPVSIVAVVLMIAAIVPALIASWPLMWAMVGNGVLLAFTLFAVVGILVGHLLGGPDPYNRSVLALATGARHPGVAMAIVGLNFPEQKKAVLGAILFHLIVGAIVAIPYVKWRKRRNAERIADAQA